MKKVLFYTDTPLLGGAENQMLLLAKYLPREKYEVTLACASGTALNPWCQHFMEMDVRVQRLKVWHKHDPRHYLYLRKLLPQFDLFHAHVWNPASCRYAMLAAQNIPLVVTEHDPFPLTGIKGWLKNKLFKNIKAIITASNAAKDLVMQQNAALEPIIHVVHNGIDVEEWRTLAKLESRNEYKLKYLARSLNEKIILCVAELHERKGQKYLIEAMKKVASSFPQAKLVIVGDGARRRYYEKLARLVPDNVAFLGRRKDVAQLMAASDVFVLPSVREAFGLVILEAAVAGLPVIATSVGGIPEIIENGKTGITVPSHNSDALADAICSVLANPANAFELVKAAQNRVEIEFNAKTMAQKTAEVYDEVLH
ncbi:MAG: glycosyltransferase family 4 protein [Patescibacteria group bacterium]